MQPSFPPPHNLQSEGVQKHQSMGKGSKQESSSRRRGRKGHKITAVPEAFRIPVSTFRDIAINHGCETENSNKDYYYYFGNRNYVRLIALIIFAYSADKRIS